MMKSASLVLLFAFGALGAAEAQACRIPPQPAALRNIEADAIVLALVTDVKVDGENWSATATARGTLMGKPPEGAFSFARESEAIVISCDQSWPPKPHRYSILYFQRTAEGLRMHRAYPYRWARASGDPRLARLDRLLPLGPVREPTPEEARLLDFAEARLELPAGVSDLSRYTRVYERASASWVVGRLMRSRKPRRLIVDSGGELPTEKSCRCKLINVLVQLDDLWAAGKLPPFNP